jgi:hypothetical protein
MVYIKDVTPEGKRGHMETATSMAILKLNKRN